MDDRVGGAPIAIVVVTKNESTQITLHPIDVQVRAWVSSLHPWYVPFGFFVAFPSTLSIVTSSPLGNKVTQGIYLNITRLTVL